MPKPLVEIPGVHLEIVENPKFDGDRSNTVQHWLSLTVDKKVDNVHDDTVLGMGKVVDVGKRETDFRRMYNRVESEVPNKRSRG